MRSIKYDRTGGKDSGRNFFGNQRPNVRVLHFLAHDITVRIIVVVRGLGLHVVHQATPKSSQKSRKTLGRDSKTSVADRPLSDADNHTGRPDRNRFQPRPLNWPIQHLAGPQTAHHVGFESTKGLLVTLQSHRQCL